MEAIRLIPLIRHDCRLVVLRSVDSTNDEIRRLLAVDTSLGTTSTPSTGNAGGTGGTHNTRMPVVLSERQTSGRGRHGHVWISPPGSVYLSLLWISAAKPSQAVSLPLVAALATREALASFTTCPISLKWPNDLLTPEGKLAGILVENTDMPGAWIIGVGANVTPPHRVEEGFAKAAYVGTKSAEIETVAAALVNSLLDNLHVWEQEGCSFAPFEKDYQRYLLKKGND